MKYVYWFIGIVSVLACVGFAFAALNTNDFQYSVRLSLIVLLLSHISRFPFPSPNQFSFKSLNLNDFSKIFLPIENYMAIMAFYLVWYFLIQKGVTNSNAMLNSGFAVLGFVLIYRFLIALFKRMPSITLLKRGYFAAISLALLAYFFVTNQIEKLGDLSSASNSYLLYYGLAIIYGRKTLLSPFLIRKLPIKGKAKVIQNIILIGLFGLSIAAIISKSFFWIYASVWLTILFFVTHNFTKNFIISRFERHKHGT